MSNCAILEKEYCIDYKEFEYVVVKIEKDILGNNKTTTEGFDNLYEASKKFNVMCACEDHTKVGNTIPVYGTTGVYDEKAFAIYNVEYKDFLTQILLLKNTRK